MDTFAALPVRDRTDAINEAAARRGVRPTIIEKDFWVCWTLQHLFFNDILPGPLFKGGTTLSKVYGVIKRFSEDIDITLDRARIGFGGEEDPANQPSKKKSEKKRKLLLAKASSLIKEFVMTLQSRFEAALGPKGWTLHKDAHDPDDMTIVFAYPGPIDARATYVRPEIRIEFGARGETWPAQVHPISPYVCEDFPELFISPSCEVKVLCAERTFWEKVVLLHSTASSGNVKERYSRHYYDVARMYRHDVGRSALNDRSLLGSVVRHKASFFPGNSYGYPDAREGSLRIVPPPNINAKLRKDFALMVDQGMFFETISPNFDEILQDLSALERELNG